MNLITLKVQNVALSNSNSTSALIKQIPKRIYSSNRQIKEKKEKSLATKVYSHTSDNEIIDLNFKMMGNGFPNFLMPIGNDKLQKQRVLKITGNLKGFYEELRHKDKDLNINKNNEDDYLNIKPKSTQNMDWYSKKTNSHKSHTKQNFSDKYNPYIIKPFTTGKENKDHSMAEKKNPFFNLKNEQVKLVEANEYKSNKSNKYNNIPISKPVKKTSDKSTNEKALIIKPGNAFFNLNSTNLNSEINGISGLRNYTRAGTTIVKQANNSIIRQDVIKIDLLNESNKVHTPVIRCMVNKDTDRKSVV